MGELLQLPNLHRQPMMGFGAALSALKQGYSIARTAWKRESVSLTIEERVEGDVIWLVTKVGKIYWSSEQIDILAQDWVILEDSYR